MSVFDVGDAIGAGLSFFGQRERAKAAREAAQLQADAAREAAAAAASAATPYTVASLGGIAEFDPDKQAALLTLSPELSDIYQGGLGRSGLFGTQAADYAFMDPFAAGEQFYQQMQPFFQEEEDKARTDLETRLLAQGRLGGTGGAEEQRALEEAIQKSRAQRRTAGFTQAQSLIDTLLGRERGDIAQSVGLLDIPLQQANVGRGIGGTVGSVAASGLQSQAASQRLLAQTAAQDPGLFGTLASGIGGTIRTNSLINRLKER
mgnify:CR=1 FL=1|tara:strand:- start:2305 stop:3090 length:786 start_codon:yes stop_codon:yes gene_type:complete